MVEVPIQGPLKNIINIIRLGWWGSIFYFYIHHTSSVNASTQQGVQTIVSQTSVQQKKILQLASQYAWHQNWEFISWLDAMTMQEWWMWK